jgi:quercetin dioxygenase-like cupin family protein
VKFKRADEQPISTEWHTQDGIFIKSMLVKRAGTFIPQHAHEYAHTSMLAYGSVFLWKDGKLDKQYRAPCAILIDAGVKHLFQALEEGTLIYCIHNLHGAEMVSVLAEHDLLGEG